jgi:DUF1707 SHOCT-like domain
MNDAPTNHRNDVPQPSTGSARETAFKGLARQTIGGGLTLDEYAERAAAAQRAATAEELDALLQGLPEEAAGALAARRPRWLVSVLAGRERRGRWRLRDHLRVIAVFTVRTLDLGTAQPESPESLITIITAFGGASIIVPQGVSIQLSGSGVFGGSNDNRAELPPFPGSPLIRIRAFSLFGGVKLDDRPPRRDLLDTSRARSSKPAGG